MDNTEKLNNFLNTNSSWKKIIVIYWPTACGKTSLWIEIAKKINSEIISTDSRQIFNYLNIGTGKVTKEEADWVKHHMIDIINPDRNYSVWEFKAESQNIITNLHSHGKIPILVGWTWLYIDSLIYDFDIPKVPADSELRKKFEAEAQEFGKEYVYNKLLELDNEYAQELHPNNLHYVIRWLEVKILSWKSKKDFRTEKKLKYDTLFLTPYNGDRETLYQNINARVQNMFDNWFVNETQNILNLWYKKTDFWLKTIGYEEIIDYLEWKINYDTCIELVKQYNRNYAKKQLTWFWKYI